MTATGGFLIAGGGTGGHVFPALALADELRRRRPEAAIVFVGTRNGLEAELVPRAGWPLEFVRARGIVGKGLAARLRGLAALPLAFADSLRLLSRHAPSAVVGVGGYSSGPVVATAWARRVPTVIHESNAVPGLTNRLLARIATRVAAGTPAAAAALPGADVTGNPVREAFFRAPSLVGAGEGAPLPSSRRGGEPGGLDPEPGPPRGARGRRGARARVRRRPPGGAGAGGSRRRGLPGAGPRSRPGRGRGVPRRHAGRVCGGGPRRRPLGRDDGGGGRGRGAAGALRAVRRGDARTPGGERAVPRRRGRGGRRPRDRGGPGPRRRRGGRPPLRPAPPPRDGRGGSAGRRSRVPPRGWPTWS